jgi:hypothetical protein
MLGLGIVLIVLSLPGSALGSTVDRQDGSSQVTFDAVAGFANHLTLASTDSAVTITDTAENIVFEPGTVGCTHPGGDLKKATCTDGDEINFWRVQLGDLADTIVASGPMQGSVFGDAGGDQLTGGAGDDFLDGGPGHDTIVGNDGNDFGHGFGVGADGDNIDLGAGDDFAEGVSQGNVINLGPGDDGFFFASDLPSGGIVDGGPGIDEVDASAGVGLIEDLSLGRITEKTPAALFQSVRSFEDLRGGSRLGDTVTGTVGANLLDTSGGGLVTLAAAQPTSGNEVVNPLAGADLVRTGEGNDQITSNDGYADRINCGVGTDTVRADQLDELVGCEAVTIARTRPAFADTVTPKCAFTRAAKKAKRSSFLKGYAATFRCDESVSVLGRLLTTAKRKRGKTVLSRAGDVVLAEKSTSAGQNAPKKLTLKVSKKLRKALGKKFTARVVLEARDEFGNRITITRTVKVSTPKKKRRKK